MEITLAARLETASERPCAVAASGRGRRGDSCRSRRPAADRAAPGSGSRDGVSRGRRTRRGERHQQQGGHGEVPAARDALAGGRRARARSCRRGRDPASATGDVLMSVADADYRAQVRVQESAVETARSARTEACRQAELAQRDLARNLRLASEKIVSPELLDQLQSRRDVAAASCETARSRIRQARGGARCRAGEPGEDGAARAVRRHRRRRDDRSRRVDHAVASGPPDPAGHRPLRRRRDVRQRADGRGRRRQAYGVGQPVRVTLDAYPGAPSRAASRAWRPTSWTSRNRTGPSRSRRSSTTPASRGRSCRGPPPTSRSSSTLASGVLRIPSYALLEGDRVLVVRDGRLVAQAVKTV